MRVISIIMAATVLSVPAFAQQIQRSSNPQGVQIQGNTNIQAENQNTSAIAVGQGNESRNISGAIKGGTQIQGHTEIRAKQVNATAVTVGKDNKASNEAGVIGGK